MVLGMVKEDGLGKYKQAEQSYLEITQVFLKPATWESLIGQLTRTQSCRPKQCRRADTKSNLLDRSLV